MFLLQCHRARHLSLSIGPMEKKVGWALANGLTAELGCSEDPALMALSAWLQSASPAERAADVDAVDAM